MVGINKRVFFNSLVIHNEMVSLAGASADELHLAVNTHTCVIDFGWVT